MTQHLSLLVAITGPRGGGKTLLMSHRARTRLIRGIPVWANYKIDFKHNGQHYQSQPLDMNALYTLSPDLQNGEIYIDEMQYFADSMRSSSNANKLLDGFIMQLRKRNLSLWYTVKNFKWVDNRIRYETDISIHCQDISFRNPGNIQRGTLFELQLRDLSGLMTGYTFEEKAQPYNLIFSGKKFWNIYDSNEVIDVFEAFTPVKMALSQRVISNVGDNSNRNAHILHEMVADYITEGKTHIPVLEFHQDGFARGMSGKPDQWMQGLVQLGARRREGGNRQFYWDLTGVATTQVQTEAVSV